MTLTRYHHKPDVYGQQISSAGRWRTADRRWVFYKLKKNQWVIRVRSGASYGHLAADVNARTDLLKTAGLFYISFKTRREAVAALELMLAGLPTETESV